MRTIHFPVTEDQLTRLGPRCERVQFDTYSFSTPPTETDLERLAKFLRGYPEVALRVYGSPTTITDLEFLRHFTFVRRFYCDVFELQSLEGLRFLPDDVTALGLGRTRKRFSLTFLTRFRQLRDLYLEGHSRDFGVIGNLKHLEEVTLRSVSVPSLAPLVGLQKLWWLDMKLGGTRNLEDLRRLHGLKYLELWRIRGMDNIEPISDLTELQYLFLEDLSLVTSLPRMAKLQRLRRVDLWGLKRLRDMSPLLDAKSLEELYVYKASHLRLDDFKVLRGHPSLQRISVGTGSLRRNEEIEKSLGIAEATRGKGDFDFR